MNKKELLKALRERYLTHDDLSLQLSLSCLIFQGGKYTLQLTSDKVRKVAMFFEPLCTWDDIDNPLNAPILPFVKDWEMSSFNVMGDGELMMRFHKGGMIVIVELKYNSLTKGYGFKLSFKPHPMDMPSELSKKNLSYFMKEWRFLNTGHEKEATH